MNKDTTDNDRPGGKETILVVEDDKDLREFLGTALGSLGYTILLAQDGRSAQEIMETTGSIDLLLTDVVLPEGINGHDVAENFRGIWPEAGVLFSSGYAKEFLHTRGELDENVMLMNKPFRLSVLAQKIREILDTENP